MRARSTLRALGACCVLLAGLGLFWPQSLRVDMQRDKTVRQALNDASVSGLPSQDLGLAEFMTTRPTPEVIDGGTELPQIYTHPRSSTTTVFQPVVTSTEPARPTMAIGKTDHMVTARTTEPSLTNTHSSVARATTTVPVRSYHRKPTTRTASLPTTPSPTHPTTLQAISTRSSSPTHAQETCVSVRRDLKRQCNSTAGETCIDTAIGPICIHNDSYSSEAVDTSHTTEKPENRRSASTSTVVVLPTGSIKSQSTSGPSGERLSRNDTRGLMNDTHGCVSPRRAFRGECNPQWIACCPGMPGDPDICGDPDCNTHRKPGRPCLGIFMQLECPQICGLCDNHDLQRSEKVEASIKAVERSSIAEFERLQAAFRKVLPAVRLGASHTHPDGDPALLQEAPLWGDEWADTVIFVTVTIGFLDFFQNWRETARRAGISRFMVIAEDAKVYERLKSHTSDVARMSVHVPAEKAVARAASANAENEGMGGALPYSSAAYKSLVNRRPRYIRALLSLGVNVVYSDIDTVWMRSPFRGFIGNHTMWIQSDMIKPTDYRFHSLCTGLMALKPTSGTRELMLDWEHALVTRGDTQHGNQFIFNTVAWRHIRLGSVSILPLEPKLFPSGALSYLYPEWLSRQNEQPLVIHNNYMVGRAEKRSVFVSHGLWFIDV